MSSLANEVIALGHTIDGIREIHPDDTGRYLTVVLDDSAGVYRVPIDQLARTVEAAVPADRADVIRRVLAATIETDHEDATGTSWDAARLLLLRTMLVPTSAQARCQGNIVGVEVLPGVAETAVLDRPTSIAQVTAATVAGWQVTTEEALAAGRDNLDRAPDSAQWRKVTGQPLWTLEGDDYSTARLVQPGWLDKHGPPGTGRVIFAMPTRTTVLTGRLPSVEPLLARIAETTQQTWRDALAPVSPVIYTLDGDEINALRWTAGDTADVLRRGELTLAAIEYHRQDTQVVKVAGDHWATLQRSSCPALSMPPSAQPTLTRPDDRPASLRRPGRWRRCPQTSGALARTRS